MTEVSLRAMKFHALVGILPHERTLPQPIEVDVHVRISDEDAVVDYRALYDLTAAVMNSGPIDYLEEIGTRIARAALEHSRLVRSARVAVRKPHVALPGPLAYAEVVIERSADD
jgi:dihydroneopterin aldolase